MKYGFNTIAPFERPSGRHAVGLRGVVFCILANGLSLVASGAAPKLPVECKTMTLVSTVVSVQQDYGDSQNPGLHFAEADAQAKDVAANTANGEYKLSILGPVFGSMDAQDVQMDAECSSTGLLLKATTERSGGYLGGVLKNALWRPRIEMVFRLKAPEPTLKAVWALRTKGGPALTHAQSPPYPEQVYPMVATRNLSDKH